MIYLTPYFDIYCCIIVIAKTMDDILLVWTRLCYCYSIEYSWAKQRRIPKNNPEYWRLYNGSDLKDL